MNEKIWYNVLKVLASLACSIVLAALWHLLGFALLPTQSGYPFTQYFTCCIDWPFVIAFALVSIALGWISRSLWPVVCGMVLPLPIAFGIEVIQDPTSHNLIPFEIIIYWIPAFVVAFCGTYCGRLLQARFERRAT
jgi:hypothetical protein